MSSAAIETSQLWCRYSGAGLGLGSGPPFALVSVQVLPGQVEAAIVTYLVVQTG